jgi:FlaA1/EpsC-like NDP-sugar epimerase
MQNVFQKIRTSSCFSCSRIQACPLMEENPSQAILTNIEGTKIG